MIQKRFWRRSRSSMLCVALTPLFLAACSSDREAMDEEAMRDQSPKEIVQKAMVAFFRDFNPDGIKQYLTEDYIQHNPNVPTGREPILGILPMLEEAKFGFTTHRILQDGNLVLTHTTYHNAEIFGANQVVAFDLWRVEGDQVAEHWDAITPLVTESASGLGQTDGPTEITDRDRTEANKKLVEQFVQEVLIKEDFSKMEDYIRNGLYDQHNPLVKNGPEALKKVISEAGLKNHKIHRVIGEGSFVLTQSEGSWNGKPMVIYDLFRVEDGYIVEHWDVLQEIPAKMAHENGMF